MSKIRMTRYQMYTRLFSKLPLPLSGKILGISGMKFWTGSPNYKPERKVLAEDADITKVDYPEVDAQKLPFEDNTFDWVICDQVLEHVEGDPQKVTDEIHRVLKKGGKGIIATGFIAPIHYGPKDMWRFSPDGLRYLCREFDSIDECDGWGNKWVHILFFLYGKSRDWKVPDRKFSIVNYLATLNDDLYPLHTWIIATK